MLVPGSANPLLLRSAAAAATGISRSLRFNSSDSAYLSRTPASAGNRKTWTWAGWVKRSSTDSDGAIIFSSSPSAGANTYICFAGSNSTATTADGISFFSAPLSVNVGTAGVFRDFSAWFHLVVAVDTTQGTAANRVKIYINGTEATYASTSYPTSSQDLGINAAFSHTIGTTNNLDSWAYFNGYLADIHFIDGQALTPSSFTETDATTGQLIPKAYTGSYGTNGFRLTFADNSAATATTLGKDAAGSNNWTPNNLSVTAGAGNDSLVDVPTNGTASSGADPGGSTRGNYCTLNPLDNGGITLTNGNLDWSRTSAGTRVCYSTIGVSSGKWYFESSIVGATSGVNWECGVATVVTSNAIRPGTTATGWQVQTSGSTTIVKQNNNTTTTIFTGTISSGDIFSVALDMDNGRIWFGRNGTWLEGSPSAGTGASFTNLSGTVEAFAGGDGAVSGSINFGQRPFAYTAPSGFKALCTANLPAPLVTKPSTVMDVALYTGNASTNTITGLGFNPDLVWIKSRSNANWHNLFDAVRGNNRILYSNATNAEEVEATASLTSFNSDGFTLSGNGSSGVGNVNGNGTTYVAWTWDAGSSTDTNTQGSISSQVRANASAGFSVVTFTKNNGSSNAATFGHGLNATPHLIITKARNLTEPWYTYHHVLGNNGRVQLNETSAATIGTSVWGTTSPTSQVFTMQGVFDANFVAYCFAPVVGYSSFGSYTGNGSADGPFVYTGFRPRYFFIKRSDSTGDWRVYDAARSPYNTAGNDLLFNSSQADADVWPFDIVSNGFKARTSDTRVNASGATFVYAAFAESPFNYARAR